MKSVVNVLIPSSEAREYPIIIGSGVLKEAGKLLRQYTRANKVLIVTNETVWPLYGESVEEVIKSEGIAYKPVILPDGEVYKNFASFETILTEAIDFRLERKDAIVALGGGVVGDMAGYAAASYLRGVDFVQIPTTLLAQVDSSVGGKVAINHSNGKNLVGAFYQPKFVLSDTDTLNTLPVEQLKVGLAEVLKYGFIEKTCGYGSDKLNLTNWLRANKEKVFNLDESVLSLVISYCCELKAAVVSQDEKEAGLRAILNFGHTIGHAIEKATGYIRFNHGEAVAIGMKGAFSIALDKGLISKDYMDGSLELINAYEMNYRIPSDISKDSLVSAMSLDKKVESGKVRFVLSNRFAEVDVYSDVSSEQVLKAIDSLY